MSESESPGTFLETVARATWDVFRKDALLFVLAAVVVYALSAVSLGICFPPLAVGFSGLVRRRNQGHPATVGDVFSGFDRFGSSFVAMMLVILGSLVGAILLVLPGVLFALFSSFALQAIAYESTSAVDGIKRSFELVRRGFLNVAVLLLCITAVHAVGHGSLIGLLLSTPLCMIAQCVAFERLSASAPAAHTLGPSAVQSI
jgi:uncharacterized membrane protein